ncbi:E3 ubiquitin-protein ligase TRIM21-like [Xenentodon cancila]
MNLLHRIAALRGLLDKCSEINVNICCLWLSYCETHLEPHLTAPGLIKHQLVEPVENLENRICTKHNKYLELFCKNDQTCVCMLCSVLDHKTHELVPLREEYEGKKAELEKTEAEIQQMIQKRQLKIQEIKESLKISNDAADREKTEGVQVFTDLKESVERSLKKFIKEMEDKQKTTEKQAEDLIKDLEQEISELKKRSSEVEQLSRSEDHLHLLQRFSSLKDAPPTKNWTEVRVHPPSYEGTVVRAVDQLEKNLIEKMKKLLAEVELRRIQKYEVHVILDPDTANPKLVLSDVWENAKVGVLVDYEEGLVSFYDVNAAALIFSFTGCSFKEKLHLFFSPGLSDGVGVMAPLIICPVNQTV